MLANLLGRAGLPTTVRARRLGSRSRPHTDPTGSWSSGNPASPDHGASPVTGVPLIISDQIGTAESGLPGAFPARHQDGRMRLISQSVVSSPTYRASTSRVNAMRWPSSCARVSQNVVRRSSLAASYGVDHDRAATTSRARSIASIRIATSGRLLLCLDTMAASDPRPLGVPRKELPGLCPARLPPYPLQTILR
jgi:hypothetical protein